MFMKAILYNKEDDLHFLLKCLVEKIEDDLLLKQEDDFFDPKSRADDKLEDEIFDEDSIQDMAEQDAMKESDFGDIKEGKSDNKVKAKVMNKLSTGFYADVKRAIEAEQKKSPKPLTRQQKEKITFDLREKAYKKFISEGKPLEIKLKNTSYKWTVDEIKDTWKEFTADRDNELRRQEYVKNKTELKYKKNLLNSFVLKKPDNFKLDSKITPPTKFNLPPKDSLDALLLTSKIYEREVKRGMTKRHPKGTKEYKIIQDYFDALDAEDKKIRSAFLKKTEIANIKDSKKRTEKRLELEKIIEDATEEKKKLHVDVDKKLPKDAEGNPIWVAEFKLTDEEKKEHQDRIKELETKIKEDEKFFKEIQRDSVRVSPIQVMQADKDLAGVAKKLKKLLENQAVKDYLKGKKNPLEGKALTAYMKGSYSDAKLRAFLETDAKAKGIREKARGKRIPLGDGAGVKKEAYRRIYNYIQFLTKEVKEKSKKGTVKSAVKRIQSDLKEHNDKLFRDLDSQQRKRFGAASKYTRAAYASLARSLKNMKQISDRQDTSENKRMLQAKKVLENEKYGMTLMRDLMNIALGQKLEKPPKKQRKPSRKPSKDSRLSRKIKEIREKVRESDKEFKNLQEKMKGKGLNNEETTKYFQLQNLRDELADKAKELRERVENRKEKPRRKSRAKIQEEAYLRQRREKEAEREQSRRLNKAEDVGEKTGLNAFRFFDVNMVGKTYVLEERESALNTKDPNYADIEKFANQIKDILSDKKIMSAIEKTYSKLTGGTVFGQDKRSAEKRKQISTALESLKPLISDRRKLKKLLKPIPDFLVKEMIEDKEALSENFMQFLKSLDRMQIVDVSNILVNNNKLVSDKNKVKGIGGSPYYNIFNKPIAVPLTYRETKGIKSLFDYDEKLSEELIQATKDEYSEDSDSFLRDYWNVVIKKMKDDMDKLGNIYGSDEGRKEAYIEQAKKNAPYNLLTDIQEEFSRIHNPSNKKKKAFDEFFLALDKKQDGKAFFKEVEDLIKSIIKLQKEYITKKTKQKDKLDLNKVAKEYAIEAIRRMDKAVDDKTLTEPSQDILSEEDSEKETERITAQLKPLQDKLKEMRKDDNADEEELSNLIEEIKKLKREIDELKTAQTVKTTFGNKTYRFTSPIPISVDTGKKIIMGALEPLARQKKVDSVEQLFETDIDDSVLIEALEKQFLIEFKKNKDKVKEIVLEQELDVFVDSLILDQLKDEFEDLIKTFKSKKTVIDMSKVEFDINDTNLRKILTDAQLGEELAEIVKTDLTDVYDSYVKRLDKVKTTHVKNTEKAKEISKDLIQTIGTLEEDNPTYKTKEGDEEE